MYIVSIRVHESLSYRVVLMYIVGIKVHGGTYCHILLQKYILCQPEDLDLSTLTASKLLLMEMEIVMLLMAMWVLLMEN